MTKKTALDYYTFEFVLSASSGVLEKCSRCHFSKRHFGLQNFRRIFDAGGNGRLQFAHFLMVTSLVQK